MQLPFELISIEVGQLNFFDLLSVISPLNDRVKSIILTEFESWSRTYSLQEEIFR